MKTSGIYILTSPSGKSYVGKDNNLPKRPNEHLSGNSPKCPAIHDAILKYGAENFSVEIIPYPNVSDQILSWFECSHIAELDSFRNGYNLTWGGDGCHGRKLSDKTRQKISESNKGQKRSPETCRRNSEAQKGKKLSAETCRKMSASRKGKKRSPEIGQKISTSLKGRKLAPEHRRKMSESASNRSPEVNRKLAESRKGKKRSSKTRRKMSESAKKAWAKRKESLQ